MHSVQRHLPVQPELVGRDPDHSFLLHRLRIADAEEQGLSVIIHPVLGDPDQLLPGVEQRTCTAVAMVAAARGYRCVLVMPDTMIYIAV